MVLKHRGEGLCPVGIHNRSDGDCRLSMEVPWNMGRKCVCYAILIQAEDEYISIVRLARMLQMPDKSVAND